jgi:signal-transduction protein with cAMP-binding, CBS, and nucleotidyltransferase domain
MLETFEVRDLPRQKTAQVLESTPVRVVADMVRAGGLTFVVVMVPGEPLRGVVRGDAVLRVVQRSPEAPVGLLPTMGVLQVLSSTPLVDAVRLAGQPNIGVLLSIEESGWWVVSRDELMSFSSWEPLVAARDARLAAERPAEAQATAA